NSFSVSTVQVTPNFLRFSLAPKMLGVVPAFRPRTPKRLGPTVEASPSLTVWQATQDLVMNSSLPLAASPDWASSPPAPAAEAASRAARANMWASRIADIGRKLSQKTGAQKPQPGGIVTSRS